ncbi:MAG: hypothetical protein WEC75_09635 [Dehalococcoidia bacterium]
MADWTVPALVAVVPAVVGFIASLFARAAFTHLIERLGWDLRPYSGRILIISVVALVIAIGGIAIIAVQSLDENRLSPGDYASKLSPIACELGDPRKAELARLDKARESFLRDPNNYTRPYLDAVRAFADDEAHRIEEQLENLDVLTRLGPPKKYSSDHDDYVAIWKTYHRLLRTVEEIIPDGADHLSNAQLAAKIIPDLEKLIRSINAVWDAATIAKFNQEFAQILSCTTPNPPATPESEPTPLPTRSAGPSLLTPPEPKRPSSSFDLEGRWQYFQEADYFVFSNLRTLEDGSVAYGYREICQPNERVKGTGTAIVAGDSVSMDGHDDIGTYLLLLTALPDGATLSGVRTRTGLPDFRVTLVKGTFNWSDTACESVPPEGLPTIGQ